MGVSGIATMPAPNQTKYQANLLGLVVPNALDTHWWFLYATSPTLSGASTTASMDAGSGTSSVTVTASISNLTAGQTYYFALVAQNSDGTVDGFTQSFVASSAPSILTPSQVPPPSSVAQVITPHLAWPFAISDSGAAVLEQNTGQEIFACIQAIANTQLGQIPELPSFGIPDPTFSQMPPNLIGLTTAIQQQEPRATESAVVTALDDVGASWQITVTPTASTASQT